MQLKLFILFIFYHFHLLIIYSFLIFPRCQAACVAVTTAIALMLQQDEKHLHRDGRIDSGDVIKEAYEVAKSVLPDKKDVRDLLLVWNQ